MKDHRTMMCQHSNDHVCDFCRVGAERPQPAAQAAGLTDEEIMRVWFGMSHAGHDLEGQLRTFARALLSRAAPSGEVVANREAYDLAYDKIDRFLRSNLNDDDYAEFSRALDSLAAPQPSAQMFGATSEHNGGTSEHKASAQQPAEEARGVDAMREALEHIANDGMDAGMCAVMARDALLAAPAAGTGQEPVAVVGPGFQLCWLGSGPIAPLVERHGIKVGSKLYTAPQAATGAQGLTREAVASAARGCMTKASYTAFMEEIDAALAASKEGA